ncbi:peptidoglycan editing factor PgeF [Shewanella surugensis]|uniref:Purine nucleoside phosphorylase n=1 Tax=Shewanella surugensis TaxID=212020 RepID=A0ABT0LJJ7_9GAMM|nr:peptidoglycan editing factor PgeF [Shewanella surugensis]MCL1127540.1 peptidoglycan editing factor PgeF [Shewanella surugensis]
MDPAWFIPPNVNIAFSTRLGGVSLSPYDSLNLGCHVGDNPKAVLDNRALIQSQLALTAVPAWLEQVHGVDVVKADSTRVHQADGSVSTQTSEVCVVMTADCLPILLCDKQGTQVAAVHAGWRGLCDGIIESALAHFKQEDIIAYLGPCVGPTVFEVGPEVRQQFIEKDATCTVFFKPVSDKYLADLQGLACYRLKQAGVSLIYQDKRCTYLNPETFFSYRRDGVTGRMASFIWLS